MYNTTHLFEIDGNHYVFDFRNIFFSLLDTKTYNELKLYLSDNDRALIQPDSLVATLVENGFFLSSEPDKPVPKFRYDTLNISFAPVHNCNLACVYCYAQGGAKTSDYQLEFSKGHIDKLLNYIYCGKYSGYLKYKFDFVSGGEPLLNFPILEYFLKQVRYFERSYNKQTTILIVTNGTLLTEDVIECLDRYDVYLGISIDGDEKIHNQHRMYKNGLGTYQDIVKGINTLHRSKTSSKIKEPWAMAVVAKDSGSLVDLMENCVSLGFTRMQMQLLRLPKDHPLHLNNTDLKNLKRNYVNLFSHIIEHIKKGDLSRLKMIANDNDSFGKFLGRLLLRIPTYYRCFAGKNKISVTASGKIYPCDSFCGVDKFCMGTMDGMEANSVEQLFGIAHINNRLKCSNCWARLICGGDCYFNSYISSGNILTPNQISCEMNMFFIEHAISMLLEINSINTDYIRYLTKFFRISYTY